ncbi:unnamed protein product [Bursaphelenchus xylophilus]|uniref:(pine wood nematode) hypothetical protein n=1 Tax=Bursaphelenchus xylophilus TaxID=6326 RepID=A0A1I7S8N2_BURXY|nr:unnamed protein product [Bursaphelenchus xylophilus]CAG9089447.1 unnamed protein product [Bursaphelenchus xylophilus]
MEDIEEISDTGEGHVTSPIQKTPPKMGWAEAAAELPKPRNPRDLPTLATKPAAPAVPSPKQLFSPPPEFAEGERSPAFSEPAGMGATSQSPSGLLSPSSDLQQMHHSKSFDSSSLSSRSSKRTTLSAEMSSMIRQRVRQQAKSIVERKRGSVQLNKRLLRSQTLQGSEKESFQDYQSGDKLIEQALKMGAKYVAKGQSILPADYIQREFFLPEPVTPLKDEKSYGIPTIYSKPRSTEKDRVQFGAMLTIYKPLPGMSIEDPLSRMYPQTFKAQTSRKFNLILPRHGDRFQSPEGGILGLSKEIMTRKILRPKRDEDEDFGLIEYTNPIPWDDWEAFGLAPTKYYQLCVDINKIEFDHHWLFGEEDVLARRVRRLHSDYVHMTENLVELWRDVVELRRRLEFEILVEEEKRRLNLELESKFESIQRLRSDVPRLGELMERSYEELKEFWEKTGRNSSHYRLVKLDEVGSPEYKNLELPMYELRHQHVKDGQPSQPATSRLLPRQMSVQDQLAKQDQERRQAMEKCRVRVDLYFNKILVCRTEAKLLENDFSVTFGQVYNLRVHEQPDSVELVVQEKFGGNAWRTMAQVFVPFEWHEDSPQRDLEAMDFASDWEVAGFKGSIGCGDPPKSPHINGRLFCNAIWMEDEKPWNYDKSAQKNNVSSDDTFHLIPKETLLQPKDEKDMKSQARLDALQRRFQSRRFGGQTFQADRIDQTRIGLVDDEVEQTFIAEEFKAEDSALGVGMNESHLDVIRDLAQQYAVSLRQNLFEASLHSKHTRSYESLVREDPIPALFDFFGTLFRPPDISRKLKPMRGQRPAATTKQARYRIVINVQNAVNLPEKVNGESTNVFVDVCFRKKHAQTAPVEGRYANWQETLILELESDNDLHFEMAYINEMIEFRLYDRCVSPLARDNREINTIHEQWENKWLGDVFIPFSAVFTQGKLDGAMSVRRPAFYTDYKNFDRTCQLKVLVTIDPPLLPPKLVFNNFFSTTVASEFLSDVQKWEEKLLERNPDRFYRAIVSDTNGKPVLISQFIHPVVPPHILRHVDSSSPDEALKAVRLAAHVVSCVPFLTHPVIYAHLCDVWMTVDQMLTIGCGSTEEHAVLLCNWLLGMGFQAFLLLGTGLPQSVNTAFVYVEIPGYAAILIDPSDGSYYLTTDTTCTLNNIYVIATPTNVFGNLQTEKQVVLTDFNIKRRSCWEPLFASNRTPPPTVQKDSLVYTEVSEDVVMELRGSLEREIRLKFDQSRPYGIPQWNVLASRALREVLIYISTNLDEPPEIKDKFRSLGLNYNVCAVGIRKGYQNRQQLVDDVMNTQIHVNANSSAQFAFAVHVQPFFNKIYDHLQVHLISGFLTFMGGRDDRRHRSSRSPRDRRRSPPRRRSRSPKRRSRSPRNRREDRHRRRSPEATSSRKARDERPVKRERRSRTPEQEEEKPKPAPKAREFDPLTGEERRPEQNNEPVVLPSFEVSGKLTADTNTFKGVVIKYNEPPEAALPKLRWMLYCMKGEDVMKPFYMHRQSAYLIGRNRKIADFPVDHPSCSQQHAVLQYRKMDFERNGMPGKRTLPYIIDLGSSNGTFLNGDKIEPQRYYELKEKDIVKFGFSSREYVVLHELSAEGREGARVDEEFEGGSDVEVDLEGAEERLAKAEEDYF